MPDTPARIYWDANVFLSYVNAIPNRMPVLDALLEKSASGAIVIYTSALSHVEVAFGASEKDRNMLNKEIEQKIASLWADTEAVVSVEYHEAIGETAKDLIRGSITEGWSLKPLDAIHLATAQWLLGAGRTLAEFHTYDTGLFKYKDIVGCPILRPHTLQSRMFYMG